MQDAELAPALDGFHADDARSVAAGISELAGIGLCIGDQLLDRMDRQFRIDHQHQGEAADPGHRHEVLLDVVVDVLVQERIGRERRIGSHQQRIAVGLA